jgi:autotransporter-associated beta strand protein
MSRNLRRCGVVALALTGFTFAAPVTARGAANAPISGGFSVTQTASNAAPVQLVTGTDGRIWFLTATSELGTIASNGQETLSGVTFPHGSQPAQLVSAGPEGEWAFANDVTADGGGCVVALAGPGGDHVLQRILHHPVNPTCNGGARDESGDLWVSLVGSGSSAMSEITPAGVVTPVRAPLTAARPTSVALGSDGAIWVLERANDYGRFVPGGAATTVPIPGNATPPIPGSPFFGLRFTNATLLPRPDGTFWIVGGNVGLSSPGQWIIRFFLEATATESTVAPDGALWSVTDTAPGSPERVHRIDEWGVSDHSAALPASPRNGTALSATGPITAAADGSLWLVASDGGADFVVHYTPSAISSESIWTGTGGDGKWSNASNWMSGLVPQNGSVVVLRGTGAMTDDLPGLQLQEIVDYGSVQLSGDALSIGIDGIQVTGSNTTFVVNDPISTAAGSVLALRPDPETTLTVNGVISGVGGLSAGGVNDERDSQLGLVLLTADNTYTGATTVMNGPLRVDGHQPASAINIEAFGVLTGGGTTGAVDVDAFGSIDFADESEFYGHCPQTLTVDGDVVFDNNSSYFTAVKTCGAPAAQTVGTVLATGTVTLSGTVDFLLELSGDKPQVACLLASDGAFVGKFFDFGEGSTQPDPSGGKAVFSYKKPGGPGCLPNAFTVTTGVH